MTLSEKLQALRQEAKMTQEDVAEACGVSRQTVTKWEAWAAVPEIPKLLRLADLYHVTTDVLLKEALTVGSVTASQCHDPASVSRQAPIFEGTLIKESIDDETVLDYLNIHKVELWKTDSVPKYWTALFFTSCDPDLPRRFSKAMKPGEASGGNWFVDFKAGNLKYIVFRDRILRYTIGNQEEKQQVLQACRALGIPDTQMDWAE